jgi:hypothetical protein
VSLSTGPAVVILDIDLSKKDGSEDDFEPEISAHAHGGHFLSAKRRREIVDCENSVDASLISLQIILESEKS